MDLHFSFATVQLTFYSCPVSSQLCHSICLSLYCLSGEPISCITYFFNPFFYWVFIRSFIETDKLRKRDGDGKVACWAQIKFSHMLQKRLPDCLISQLSHSQCSIYVLNPWNLRRLTRSPLPSSYDSSMVHACRRRTMSGGWPKKQTGANHRSIRTEVRGAGEQEMHDNNRPIEKEEKNRLK